MLVQQTDSETKGRFFIEEDGIRIATMTYVHTGPGKIIIDHTEVHSSQEGKGLGKLLVKAGVDYVRANNLKILPLCPYTKKVMERMEEYHDVLF